jgi:hypothetical protein
MQLDRDLADENEFEWLSVITKHKNRDFPKSYQWNYNEFILSAAFH